MITRRNLIAALGAGALSEPLASFAQQPGGARRIGFLGVASASGYASEVEAIRERLRELGYAEGRDIVIEYRWAENDSERLKAMATELVALKVDVIVTHANRGATAAAQATTTIPIVVADSADPVATGLVASYARPGGNLTGSTSLPTELYGKRLELLKDAAPRLERVSILFSALTVHNDAFFRAMEPTARQLKVELHRFMVNALEEFPGAFAAMAQKRVEGVVIGDDPLFNANAGAVAALAATHRFPAIGITNFAVAGGLLGYSANRALVYARAANFVDRILKGANPGDLPIERAAKFDLIVNLKTAKALGIRIPPQLLQRADNVIE
jgi:putative tryptophan/tyrosine transport system substrate-binding protein